MRGFLSIEVVLWIVLAAAAAGMLFYFAIERLGI